jgi:hypothetical protein
VAAKAFPSITVDGVRYAVLRLDRPAFGPRFLLRDERGQLFGLFPNGAGPTFCAELLGTVHEGDNPLERIEFRDSDDRLSAERMRR